MSLTALAIVLVAALLHAMWNMLLARATDTNAAIAVAMVAGTVALAPVAILRWRFEAAAIPYVAVSGALELAYFALLAAAYQRAELSLVYPIARGLAPVLVLVGGALLFGQTASMVRIAGVVVVSVGVVLVRGLRSPAATGDVALAALIGVIIATYTLVDQQGLQYADALPYDVLLVGIPGVVYLAAVASRGGLPRVRRAATPSVLVGGIGVVGAYGLVLGALSLAPAASVAAVREVSVVMATALAAFVLRERVEPARWSGSAAVVIGVALVVAA